ncbi:hypothetical protein ACLMPK_12630 [Yersinia enterocolitica]|uniref:hypothetical protein n=1 Tax=Yersinia enterocolitica TaxID=630 RepID=UPI00398CC2AB
MAKRLLGNLGENTLATWCSQVGIVSTKPDTDMYGWDAILEFPREINPPYTLDHQPAPIECKIQVKSTDHTHRKLSIKLSVLERLIKSPLPAFILFIEFSGGGEPTNAFLVNLEGKISHDVLKKIRKINVVDKSNELNHKSYSISYGNENELVTLNGLGLQKKIMSYIGDNYPKYVTEKANNLEHIGYSGKNFLLNVQINNKETLNDFISMLIGEDKSISQFTSQAMDNRFNIPKQIENINLGEAILTFDKIKPFREKTRVLFSTNSEMLPIVCHCDLFLPPPVISLSNELFRYRLKSPFFEIIVHHNSHKINAVQTINTTTRFPVNELHSALRILNIIFFDSSQFTMSIEIDKGELYDLHTESIIRSETQDNNILRLIKNLEVLINLANKYGIINDVVISINELSNLSHLLEISHKIKPSNNIQISTKFSSVGINGLPFDTPIVGIGRFGLIFSGFLFYKIFSSTGKIKRIDSDMAEFNSSGLKIETEKVVYYIENKSINDLEDEISKLSEKYESESKDCLYLFPK